MNLFFNWVTDFFFSSLEILFLNDNRLTVIQTPSTNEMFSKLRFLRIENNKIHHWSSLDSLNHYQSLTKLRCKGNPIFSGTFYIIIF